MSSAAGPFKPFIRESVRADVGALNLWMRKEDREEIFHASGRSPHSVLIEGFEKSNSVFTIDKEGRPIAMFGVVGIPGIWGSPWMLGTDELKRCRSLLRECRTRLDAYLQEYRYLGNAVWSKNTVHIEWIEWLGFTFDGSDLRNGETFLHFHRRLHV